MNGTAPDGTASVASARRTELAAFLRSRRERIQPEDVGLPPGTRRRTAGLRREELAQLAGVGVTWYTWLEQGRKINASVQVLDAIATHAAAGRHRAGPPVPAGRPARRQRARRLRRLPPAAGGSAGPRRHPAPRRRSSPSGSTCSPGTRCTRRSSPASPRPRPASATRCSSTSRPRPAAARSRTRTRTATCSSPSCARRTAGTSATPPGRTSSAAWRRSARRSPPPGRPTTCPGRPATPRGSATPASARSPPPRPASRSTPSPAPAWSSTPPTTSRAGQAIARLAAGDQLTARYPCWSKHYPERTEADFGAAQLTTEPGVSRCSAGRPRPR